MRVSLQDKPASSRYSLQYLSYSAQLIGESPTDRNLVEAHYLQSQYIVLEDQSGNIDAVKLGFSTAALFGACLLGGIFLIILSTNIYGRTDWFFICLLEILIGIPLGIGLGLTANQRYRRRLVKKGYVQVNTVTAANPEGAIALHIKQSQN